MRIKTESHVYTNGTVITSRPHLMTQIFGPLTAVKNSIDESSYGKHTVRFGRLKGLSIFSSPGGTMKRFNSISRIPIKRSFDHDFFDNTMAIDKPITCNYVKPKSTHWMNTLFEPYGKDDNNNLSLPPSDKVLNHESSVVRNVDDQRFNIFDVSFERNLNEIRSFGIELIYRSENRVTVHRIAADSIAAENGQIRKDDELLAINNKPTKFMWMTEMRKILKTSTIITLTVGRRKEKECQGITSTKSFPLKVIIPNISTGLGFSAILKKSHKNDLNLYISNIYPGGSAAKTNQLRISDQILQIDNHRCFLMKKEEIIFLFRSFCNRDTVVLTVLSQL